MTQLSCLTPIGEVTLSEEAGAIVALDWGRGRDQTRTPTLLRAVSQLQDYFDGAVQPFDVPLAPAGSPFQLRVWMALREIPPAGTASYGALAAMLGSSARAVGQANASNPIPILIPCHRVTAAGGAIGGYSGGEGTATKLWLLAHERRHCRDAPPGIQPEFPFSPSRAGF